MRPEESKLIDTAEKLVEETQKLTTALFNKIRECEELRKTVTAMQEVQNQLETELQLLRAIHEDKATAA